MGDNLKYGYDVLDLGLVRHLDVFYKLINKKLSQTGDLTFRLGDYKTPYSTETISGFLHDGSNKIDITVPRLEIINPKNLPYSRETLSGILYDIAEIYVRNLNLHPYFASDYYSWGYLPDYEINENHITMIQNYFIHNCKSISTPLATIYGRVEGVDVGLMRNTLYITINFKSFKATLDSGFGYPKEINPSEFNQYRHLDNFGSVFNESRYYSTFNNIFKGTFMFNFFESHNDDFKYFYNEDMRYEFEFNFT